METRLLVLENRLRQTEEALVAERRASRRTAEVAQQVVRTCPAGVDVEEIGRLEMFSGDSDLNSRLNSMPWSQWSITVRSYFGEFNQTATRLLQRVETNVEDPIIVDNTTGNEESDRQSARPTTRDRARQETAEFLRARQAFAVSGSANPTDSGVVGQQRR